VLSVGQVVAAKRLKRSDYSIFCAAPKRIALGGKVRAVCFDKTGTLTESHLQFFGVHCIQRPSGEQGAGPAASDGGPFEARGVMDPESPAAFEGEPRARDWGLDVLCGLASAHSLSPFAGNEAGVVGNAVEVNMFQATGWKLNTQDPSFVRSPAGGATPEHELKILRRFDFSHSTMTMSAVVEHSPSGQRGIYCKGSFEQVMQRCIAKTVPVDFVSIAQAARLSGLGR